jgi:hypothetical protein
MNRLIHVTLAVVLAGVMLVGPASAAPADSVVGNGTPLSCNESNFDAALAGGGTITFDCGGPLTIQLTSPASVTTDTTIDGGSAITLTGSLATQLLIVGTGTSLLLENIILDRGFGNHLSGGAILNAGNLSLDNVTIQDSVAGVNGGAIDATGPVSIRNSTLKNNSANSGGALYEENPRPVTIDNSTFLFNTDLDPTAGVGGAIALRPGAQLTMTGGSFSSNQAVLDGGALDLAAGASAVFAPGAAGGTVFISNSALGYGGAISNNGGTLTLEGANLAHNQTLTNTALLGFGGAIDDEGAMIVDNSIFNSNQARFGGAVYVQNNGHTAWANIQHTHFIANSAAQLGGGLFFDSRAIASTVEDSSIEFNQAGTGGGIMRLVAPLSILKSSLTSNVAVDGGGLATGSLSTPASGPYVEVHDSTISDNLARLAGGGINNSGWLDLVNVTVADNHLSPGNPPNNAAGLYAVITGTVTRLENTVLSNSSGVNCFADFGADAPNSAGSNYATDTTCNLSGFNDTQGSGLDAKLGTLIHDNSFTKYHMPLPGSPLIDQGDAGCSLTDQIYALRRGKCDIGAVEFGGLLPRVYVPLMRK